MLLKYVNDSDRSIYGFEMLPPPVVDVPDDIIGQEFSSENCVANNTVTLAPKSSSQPTDVLHTCDIVNDLLHCGAELDCNQLPLNDSCNADDEDDQLNNKMESSSYASVGDVALLESNPDVNWQHNRLSDIATENDLQLPTSTGINSFFVGDGIWASYPSSASEMGCCSDKGLQCASANGDVARQPQAASPSLLLQTKHNTSAAEEKPVEDGGGDAESNRVADEWKSCAICLEDMEDDQLLVHADCGGTLCPACHAVHYDLLISCQITSTCVRTSTCTSRSTCHLSTSMTTSTAVTTTSNLTSDSARSTSRHMAPVDA